MANDLQADHGRSPAAGARGERRRRPRTASTQAGSRVAPRRAREGGVPRGHLAGAISLPRGFLEMRVEETVPRQDAPIVAYCAGGTRSLLAGRTLKEMGYANVVSMSGGFTALEERRHAVRRRTASSRPSSSAATAATSCCPRSARQGRRSCSTPRCCCIGAGGLGSPTAFYLAAAGVGTLGIVDHDVVDLSQPAAPDPAHQRPHRHAEGRVGAHDARGAQPRREGDRAPERLSSENVLEHLQRVRHHRRRLRQLPDALPRQRRLRDARTSRTCTAASSSSRGRRRCSSRAAGPCYRCLFPEPPPPGAAPSCAEAGVLGVLPGLVGCVQALETIKLILGAGEPLIGRMVHFDTLSMEVRINKLAARSRSARCAASTRRSPS